MLQQLTSNVGNIMARSWENFSSQTHPSTMPPTSTTSVTPAVPQYGFQLRPPDFGNPTPSSQLPTNSQATASDIEKVTKVPRAEYTKTSTQSSDSLAKNTITHQSQDSKKKMALLDSILNTEYLQR